LSVKHKKILIAPLDWGLGHASRSIPIIRLLKEQKNTKIYLAVNQKLKSFYESEFDNLEYIHLEGYNIEYAKKFHYLKTLYNAPKILLNILSENKKLKEIIKEYQIDAVISDNRYGLYNSKIKSVFIGHQINIQSPFGTKFLRRISDFFINKFDECWIPDGEKNNSLAGNLVHSQSLPKNAVLIGHLSRFENQKTDLETKGNLLVLLSGPEPQKTILKEILISQIPILKELFKEKIYFLVGQPENKKSTQEEGIEFISHLPQNQLENTINKSELVICRPGYSTIMEMAALQKKILAIPTPKQTEQEYLAKFLEKKECLVSVNQSDINKDFKQLISKFLNTKRKDFPYENFKKEIVINWLEGI
jgi:UDP-N-acetylglucosamine:LPS N-acetylglucosamine transferase